MSDVKRNLPPDQRAFRSAKPRGLRARLGNVPPEVKAALEPIIERIEILEGLRGDPADRAVKIKDLLDSGFTVSGGSEEIIGGGYSAPGTGTKGPQQD